MGKEQLKEKLEYRLINAEILLWSVKEVVELKGSLTRRDIASLRTLLGLIEDELKEVDNLFEELAFKTPLNMEVANV